MLPTLLLSLVMPEALACVDEPVSFSASNIAEGATDVSTDAAILLLLGGGVWDPEYFVGSELFVDGEYATFQTSQQHWSVDGELDQAAVLIEPDAPFPPNATVSVEATLYHDDVHVRDLKLSFLTGSTVAPAPPALSLSFDELEQLQGDEECTLDHREHRFTLTLDSAPRHGALLALEAVDRDAGPEDAGDLVAWWVDLSTGPEERSFTSTSKEPWTEACYRATLRTGSSSEPTLSEVSCYTEDTGGTDGGGDEGGSEGTGDGDSGSSDTGAPSDGGGCACSGTTGSPGGNLAGLLLLGLLGLRRRQPPATE